MDKRRRSRRTQSAHARRPRPRDETAAILARLDAALAHAKKLGASAAKISFWEGHANGANFEAGRLKRIETEHKLGFGIEVLVGGRKGNAAGNQLADLPELTARAVALARAGSVAHFSAYPPPQPLAQVPRHSPATAAWSVQDMVTACETILEPLRAYNSDLWLSAKAWRWDGRSLLVTSGGVRHAGQNTSWRLSTLAQRTQGTDILFASHDRSWRDLNEFCDPACLSARVLEDLRNSERLAKPPSGGLPLLLPPESLAGLLWALSLGINGRSVAKGDSPLKGRLGKRVFSPALTVVDDPHRPFSPGACQLDGDGVPTRRLDLIRRGVVQNFLYDLDSAGLAGAQPTGHDGCSPRQLEVEPGRVPHEKMLTDIRNGLLVKNLVGFGQSNILNGDFSCNVGLGFLIRNGELAGRVKDTMVAGNLYDLLGRVTLSSDRDPALNLPWALVEGARVSGKT